DHLGKGGQFNLLPRVVPGSPTVEVENIPGNGWRPFWLAGETPNEPERFAVHDGIRGELVGAGCDDLCGAAGRTVNDRGGVPVDDIAWRFPGDLAALRIHRDNVGVGVRIADQDHSSIAIDRRCYHAVLTVKRSERQLPSLFALEIIRDQAEISEEDKD